MNFYDDELLNPVAYSKHKYQQTSQSSSLFTNYNTQNGNGGGSSRNEDEYEDTAGESVSSASLQTSSQKFNFKKFNYGKLADQNYCNRVFGNCSSQSNDACIISSPGYPGIYLKNLNCKFHVKNTFLNRTGEYERLILVNDNLQLNGNICHYDPKSSGQYATSYYCDAGPRSSMGCQDYLNIYDDSTGTSPILLSRACGMGRLPKIVTGKSELILELVSASNGLLANHGFLFYAMTQKSYFNNYNFFNHFDKSDVKNEYEFNSLKAIEKLQIENCEWSMSVCTLTINDELVEEIYAKRSRSRLNKSGGEEGLSAEQDDTDGYFKIGYLFGINQYHADNDGFTIKYVIKSKNFNTIAIFLEKYKPSAVMLPSMNAAKTGNSNYNANTNINNISPNDMINCGTNDFTIETSNLVLTRLVFKIFFEKVLHLDLNFDNGSFINEKKNHIY